MKKGTPAIVFGYVVLLAMLALVIVLRVINANLTETQLFITYWFVWLTCVPVAYIAVKLVEAGMRLNK